VSGAEDVSTLAAEPVTTSQGTKPPATTNTAATQRRHNHQPPRLAPASRLSTPTSGSRRPCRSHQPLLACLIPSHRTTRQDKTPSNNSYVRNPHQSPHCSSRARRLLASLTARSCADRCCRPVRRFRSAQGRCEQVVLLQQRELINALRSTRRPPQACSVSGAVFARRSGKAVKFVAGLARCAFPSSHHRDCRRGAQFTRPERPLQSARGRQWIAHMDRQTRCDTGTRAVSRSAVPLLSPSALVTTHEQAERGTVPPCGRLNRVYQAFGAVPAAA